MQNYQAIAKGLLDAGYYSGLIEGIETCLRRQNTFIIIDCPSGTGKTLAGIALTMQGCNNNPSSVFFLNERKTYAYHLIWPTAVESQNIYHAIQASSNANQQFFERFLVVDERCSLEDLWRLLQESLPQIDTSEISSGRCNLLLIIDEVPQDCDDILKLGRIRDKLKQLPNVCVLMCGTHSKAANMVGLSQGAASRLDNQVPFAWACIITRLPRFDLEISGLKQEYTRVLNAKKSTYICEAIKVSMENGGNPLLIRSAIKTADKLLPYGPAESAFQQWQIEFMKDIVHQKFWSQSISIQHKGLIGQMSINLDATATSHLSDVLLGHHFAFRSIPDLGDSCVSLKNCSLHDCGGWLYLTLPRFCLLGNNLMFYRGKRHDLQVDGYNFWQATRFAPADKDLLLYLISYRENGYLQALYPPETFRAYEVVLPFWRSNSAGSVNFQNPNAVTSSGALLEVLLSVAVKNAGARALSDDGLRCKGPNFIRNLMLELGVPEPTSISILTTDRTISKVQLPKMLFLTQTDQFKKIGFMANILGMVERQKNSDEFDLLVKGVDDSSIRLEAKDRATFNNGEMAQAAYKLLKDSNEIGVIVVRNCCEYWGKMQRNQSNRSKLRDLLQLINGLGIVYFISEKGQFQKLIVATGPSDKKRLIVIRVGERILREPPFV